MGLGRNKALEKKVDYLERLEIARILTERKDDIESGPGADFETVAIELGVDLSALGYEIS